MIKSREIEQKVKHEFFRKEMEMRDELKNELKNEVDKKGREISNNVEKEIDRLFIVSFDKKRDLKKFIKD
jgi:hypothetical protein